MNIEDYKKYIDTFDFNLLDCKCIGKGHNGTIYMLPDGRVIKICLTRESCIKEYYILYRASESVYFPKVYGICGNYMIRDYVEGTLLSDYIKQNGLPYDIKMKIFLLFDEFEQLKFIKKDLRCKDIMVQKSNNIMVIDPKRFYSLKREYPKHLFKGLKNYGVYDEFLKTAYEERRDLYEKWREYI